MMLVAGLHNNDIIQLIPFNQIIELALVLQKNLKSSRCNDCEGQ